MSDDKQKNRKAPRGQPTKAVVSERLEILPDDIDPHHDWSRLNAHGVMNVDFEERVDFRRLHRYRLGRARQAVRNSTLGALLCFDNNNIRYITSTAIGEPRVRPWRNPACSTISSCSKRIRGPRP